MPLRSRLHGASGWYNLVVVFSESEAVVTNVQTLLERVSKYMPEDKIEVVAEAYRFAAEAHDGQTRLSGEPFVEHPLQTALYLAELQLDASALSAALLHDVIEDTEVSFDDLNGRFGEEVAKLVDGVTKLTQTEFLHPLQETDGNAVDDAEAATLRKMLMSIAEDIRGRVDKARRPTP